MELAYDRTTEQRDYEAARTAISTQPSQLAALRLVEDALQTNQPLMMFLSAYAGCGKTFVEQAILHSIWHVLTGISRWR